MIESKLAENDEEQRDAEEVSRYWSEKKLTETYRELEAVRDAVGGAVDLLHRDFDKRFHSLPDIGQEFMLEWAKGQYNSAVQQLLSHMARFARETQIHCEQ